MQILKKGRRFWKKRIFIYFLYIYILLHMNRTIFHVTFEGSYIHTKSHYRITSLLKRKLWSMWKNPAEGWGEWMLTPFLSFLIYPFPSLPRCYPVFWLSSCESPSPVNFDEIKSKEWCFLGQMSDILTHTDKR